MNKPGAEKYIIEAILYDNDLINEIDWLKAEHFNTDEHRRAYIACNSIYIKGQPIDIVSLSEFIGVDNANTYKPDIGVMKLDYHPKLVYEYYLKRKLWTYLTEVKNWVEKEDIFDLIERISIETENMGNELNLQKDVNLSEELPLVYDEIQKRIAEPTEESVLKSEYLPTFNHFTSGLLPGNLVSIEGKDKQGKTTLALTLTLDFAINQNIPVAIFSLEMGVRELIWKSISNITGIDYNKLRNPKGYNDNTRLGATELSVNYKEAKREFDGTKIFIYDKLFSEYQIYKTMKRLKRQHGVVWCLIDYIGLIEPEERQENREKSIAYLSRFFKKAARELENNPCVLSQQNRTGDIAESLGLRRDSDYCFTIMKPSEVSEENQDYIDRDGKKQSRVFAEEDFLITLNRSRHGYQGRSFLSRINNNLFREYDADLEKMEQTGF